MGTDSETSRNHDIEQSDQEDKMPEKEEEANGLGDEKEETVEDIQSFLDATVVRSKEADTKVELITTADLNENPVAEEIKKKKTKESLKRNLSQTQIKSFFKKTTESPESNKKAKLGENIKDNGSSDLPPGW